jgi:hypothetical protein
MLSVFRPSFEVVKEGRILKKIKHFQILIEDVFNWRQFGAGILRKKGMYLTEK